ncbi:MAG: GntR family transcriptional regulator [Pseudomonadota bacterium]
MPAPSPHNVPPAAATPRVQQIVDALRGDITRGALAPHTALPSERTVAEVHGVSRMTARRALERIEAEGLAYSAERRGRFVSPGRLSYNISDRLGFTTDARDAGVALEIELIDVDTTPATDANAAQLGIDRGDSLYTYTRLFRSAGHATFIETESVIAARFPELLSHDLRQSTTQLWEQHYGTHADTGDIVIRLCALREDEAALLGLAPHHPAIELEQITRDRDGAPFCLGRQVWRGEMAEFVAHAKVNQ